MFWIGSSDGAAYDRSQVSIRKKRPESSTKPIIASVDGIALSFEKAIPVHLFLFLVEMTNLISSSPSKYSQVAL